MNRLLSVTGRRRGASQDDNIDMCCFEPDGCKYTRLDWEYKTVDLTLRNLLKWWMHRTIVPGEESLMLINRENVLKSALRIVKRDEFSFCKPLKVTFSGEDGEDFGGPTREFLRLLLNDVQDQCFQGHEGNKFFIHDLEKLSRRCFEMAGSLVAFALLHGGPGLPVMHNAVYDILIGGDCDVLPEIDMCIMDVDQRGKFQAIAQATNQEEYSSSINEICEWCAEQGLSIYNYRQIEDRDLVLNILLKNEICYRVHSEIVQFTTGLNKVGAFMETARMAPEEFRSLFTYQRKSLTFTSIRSLYKVEYSIEGSNDRRFERGAIYCLEAFLADCEGGTSDITLEDVLCFWTGAVAVPPLGFDKDLVITFGATKRLPSAHTCSLTLNIWRGYSDADMFASDMHKGIRWGVGFHLA